MEIFSNLLLVPFLAHIKMALVFLQPQRMIKTSSISIRMEGFVMDLKKY